VHETKWVLETLGSRAGLTRRGKTRGHRRSDWRIRSRLRPPIDGARRTFSDRVAKVLGVNRGNAGCIMVG
jgi:hypothetical protein